MEEKTPKLRPAGEYVLLKLSKRTDKSPGGIIMPELDAKHDDTTQAEVLAVGPGKWSDAGVRIPCSVKPGDVVVVPAFFTGLEKKKPIDSSLLDGQRLMKASEILYVLEEA